MEQNHFSFARDQRFSAPGGARPPPRAGTLQRHGNEHLREVRSHKAPKPSIAMPPSGRAQPSDGQNMTFGLEMHGVPKAERDVALAKVAKLLQIEQLLTRKPGQLSGGQRQCVAMGRALVRNPDVFLFDELPAQHDFCDGTRGR